jgi:hypothetical protein
MVWWRLGGCSMSADQGVWKSLACFVLILLSLSSLKSCLPCHRMFLFSLPFCSLSTFGALASLFTPCFIFLLGLRHCLLAFICTQSRSRAKKERDFFFLPLLKSFLP